MLSGKKTVWFFHRVFIIILTKIIKELDFMTKRKRSWLRKLRRAPLFLGGALLVLFADPRFRNDYRDILSYDGRDFESGGQVISKRMRS
jgi:hypothetical protein